MNGRRAQVVAATLDVLAESGSRGLTHRAVDRRAGVPLGTTGNWFTTRDALLTACVDELERRDLDATAVLLDGDAPRDRAHLRTFVRAFLAGQVTAEGAVRSRSRIALMLERPDLVRPAHERLRATFTPLVTAALGAAPSERAVRAAAALIDGATLHAVTIRSDEEPELDGLAADVVAILGDER